MAKVHRSRVPAIALEGVQVSKKFVEGGVQQGTRPHQSPYNLSQAELNSPCNNRKEKGHPSILWQSWRDRK